MVAATSDRVEAALRRFEAYDPAGRRTVTDFWPPAIRPAGWNGDPRRVTDDTIHYDRAELAELLSRLDEQGVANRRVLISDYYSGLSSLLWGEFFEEVCAISIRPYPVDHLADGRFSICFGLVGNMPFLYSITGRLQWLDALVIDGTRRYDLVMTLYYTFRPLVAPGGVVVFVNTLDRGDVRNGIPRFIRDLRSGEADGIAHRISELSLSDPAVRQPLGIAWETVSRE